MTRVKICGITSAADRDAAVTAGADAVGVITGPTTRAERRVPVDRAASLIDDTPPFVTTVAVTMADDPPTILDIVERTGCDAVQLHGPDNLELARVVASETPTSVLVAVEPDRAPRDIDLDGVSAVVVDSVDATGAGGTGEVHDWAATRGFSRAIDRPVILAGGLTPSNVREAVRTVEPFAVDVSSGVEQAPGTKDHAAVDAFVRRAKDAVEVSA